MNIANGQTPIISPKTFAGENLDINEFPSGENTISPTDINTPTNIIHIKLACPSPLTTSASAITTNDNPNNIIPKAVFLNILKSPFGERARLLQ